MKKLIEELQTEIERRELKDIALEGLFLALQIVKSYDPWIDVGKELPPREQTSSGEMDYSIDVLMTDGRDCRVGYYRYSLNLWNASIHLRDVTHWTYLPRMKS